MSMIDEAAIKEEVKDIRKTLGELQKRVDKLSKDVQGTKK